MADLRGGTRPQGQCEPAEERVLRLGDLAAVFDGTDGSEPAGVQQASEPGHCRTGTEGRGGNLEGLKMMGPKSEGFLERPQNPIREF